MYKINIENKYFTLRIWETYGAFNNCNKCNNMSQYRIYKQNHLFLKIFNKKLYIDWCSNKIH